MWITGVNVVKGFAATYTSSTCKNITVFMLFYFKTLLEINLLKGDRGSTVVKALCYKSVVRWFDSRWCHWNFSFT